MEKKKLIRKDVFLKEVAVNETDFTISGIFSTDDEDRHGEIVDQKGWKLGPYKDNPVVLFAHDHWTPAVGKMVDIAVDAVGRLAGTIKFAVEEDTSGLAKTLFNLYKNGFMRAFSVGFENNVTEYDEKNDLLTLKENTLYEVSCVNVPANAMALAYSKGIDISQLEKLNRKRKAVLTKKDIKAIQEVVAETIVATDTSTDNAEEEKQVETPVSKGGRRRQINKAIRELLKEKNLIKN